jgi:hypothetical protein
VLFKSFKKAKMLSGMFRPANVARPLHQRGTTVVPMCAAKPSNGAGKQETEQS